MSLAFSSLLIIAAKSVAVYVFILLAIRLFGKKELAQLSVIDLVFILLISNAVQNAMVGADSTLLGGMAAATALFLVNSVFKVVSYKFPQFSKVIQGESLLLIYEGKVIQKNLETAMISQSELEAAVREHGVESCEQVTIAVLEVDGNISVVSDEFKTKTVKKRRGHRALNRQS
ncbi:MAG: DUF421 domain-containing protein [Chitinophagales bacterium]|nr:DUF421 domain-containing protein [Chitinophagales bacterium]